MTDKAAILAEEGRTADNWPQLRVSGGILAIRKGTDLNLARFNQYFNSIAVQNIATHQKPQHVTTSGEEEDRGAMATELKSTAASLDLGTSGKAALSGKPKTSIEFLRHSGMSGKQVRHLEKTGADIRDSLRAKMPEGTRFADEVLHAIILPKTGAPREIGGYTLATPMTNAFPLLDKGTGNVSVLREHR
ncbi:hypothetical protein [Pedobacter rhodius]|uniref:Uncharacterized protein n=1 Tax=Pedobacter rhodius TaxID=3004098 RepID=A0ABT4KX87_9SPHI|nr:hypothetical protein [Pedobacter sp. SJ11]MCZ4223536.1 hypothetical protein [Pedobacter sp. SJ11]